MIRRVTSAFAVTVALVFLPGAFMVPTAPAASAATYGCSVAVAPTVWVDRPFTSTPARLGPDCRASGATYASWDVRHSYYGVSDILIFDKKTSAVNGVYDWEHYGTYYVQPRNAWNPFWDLTQNTSSYVVKSGSVIGVSAARVGRYVTLSVATTYYSPAVRGYRMWPRATVRLQYRPCPTCRWRYLRNIHMAANGKATFRSLSPRIRYYRAASAATSTIWGRTSATVIR
jgi:hypothetical protein